MGAGSIARGRPKGAIPVFHFVIPVNAGMAKMGNVRNPLQGRFSDSEIGLVAGNGGR